MVYSDFKTLEQAITAFTLQISETRSLTPAQPVPPSSFLQQAFDRELDWAIAVGGEKARSEGIIAQILLEVREQRHRQVSLFSGREFNVDPTVGLNGYCDFVITLSPVQSLITTPIAVIAEAQKGDLDLGLGQCVAGIVGAWRFNQNQNRTIPQVYGAVTSGTLWRFLNLQEDHLQIDLQEYSIPPVDQVLGILCAMTEN